MEWVIATSVIAYYGTIIAYLLHKRKMFLEAPTGGFSGRPWRHDELGSEDIDLLWRQLRAGHKFPIRRSERVNWKKEGF
jgi:hypothetical protein